MGPVMRELCRLCGCKHEYLKDLLDTNNKSVADLIRQFTQITVLECENMPTKVCLDCEEKLVSFQLFILECYRIQDTLRQHCVQETVLSIKHEEENTKLLIPIIKSIKSEVEDELTAADIVYAINNDESLTEMDGNDFDVHDSVDDDDELDITIATLKEQKRVELDNLTIPSMKKGKRKLKPIPIIKKDTTEEDIKKLNELMSSRNTRPKDFMRMECVLCDVKFTNWNGVRCHYYQHHRSKSVVHCLCGFPVKSLSSMYKHVTEHTGSEPEIVPKTERIKKEDAEKLRVNDFVDFQCTTCGRSFSSWYKLSNHTERLHKVPPVVQCSCGVVLKSKSCLYKHITDHKTQSSWACDQCALVTKSEEALKKHKMRHVPKSDRRYQCPDCDKVFKTQDSLRSHEKRHIPVEQRQVYQCEHCDMKFTTRSSAMTHKRVRHLKQKSYVCDLCGYACGTGGELRQHRAIHSDDKPFVCTKCSKPFKTYSNLKTHMDTHDETSYACYICNRVLNSRRTLRKHLLVHDDKCRHFCPYCTKGFKRRQTLKVHLYTHTGDKPLSCKWCGEKFAYASTLRSHRLRCHPDKMAATSQVVYNFTNLQEEQQEFIKNNLTAALEKNNTELQAVV